MKQLQQLFLLFILFTFLACNHRQEPSAINPSLTLWYEQPASVWTEALPLGNGRLGAMVYGRTANEIIQFNEETLWTGQPHDYANPGAHNYLEELRRLLWEGNQDEAEELGNKHFMSQPLRQMSYLPSGNILLNFPGHEEVTSYQRRLDLSNAVSSVFYEIDGVQFKREVFASAPAQAVIIRLESSEREALNFSAGLNSPHSEYEVTIDGNQVILKGKANDYPREVDRNGNPYPESRLTFEARLRIENEGGELVQYGDSIAVVNAQKATLYLVAATSFIDYSDISANPKERCKKYLANLEGNPYKNLKKDHIRDYQNLFNRVSLDLGRSEISERPTDQRLTSFYQDEDQSMVALLYQYGRYLLISSSRQGTEPANLQGIWNDQLSPPWDSKYTININIQMNYWITGMTNLSELSEPLIQMVSDLAVTGMSTAKKHYNLDGWVTHHNTDIWRGAAPINNANHGIWPTGGAWLSQHLWWHYEYTNDKEYLKNKAYPILKEASRFFTYYLVPDPDNPEWLISGPSNSPETGGLVMGPTMDHQIIRNLFANTIEAAEILDVDHEFIELVKEKRAKIAPNLIGRYGQLQEWVEDKDDPDNKHRHVSHLWGLHPGNEISPLTTPDLAEACKVTLSHRGDGGTGWSRAWKINFWARLLDGDHSFLLLKNLMIPAISQNEDGSYSEGGGLYMNLFDAHPPFQIDGNFGATSGITEMMLQSHLRDENGNYFQDILPALPKKLSSGKVSGIMGKGGFEISIDWQKGDLVSVEVKSLLGNILNLRYRGDLISQKTTEGEILSFITADFK